LLQSLEGKEKYNMSNWCTIESDPVFTELVSSIGVKGVQFAELWDLEKSTFDKLKPIYGLVFLFKWQKEEHPRRATPSSNSEVFFAKQVINNACATQAILNILLNRSEVDLGKELSSFKEFAVHLPPDMAGEAIGNSHLIRTVHNSFARPEPFEMDEKVAKGEEDDVYHFIGYVPVNGKLYELDGLQPGPIELGECTAEDWLEKVRPVIQARMQRYSEKEIGFNLLAIIENRFDVLNRKMSQIKARRELLNAKLSRLSGGSGMDVDESGDAGDQPLPNSPQEVQAALHALDEEQKELEADLAEEKDRLAKWKIENTRRKHNYVPFIFNLLKVLAAKDVLPGLIEEARKAQEKAYQERKARRQKEKAEKPKTAGKPTAQPAAAAGSASNRPK